AVLADTTPFKSTPTEMFLPMSSKYIHGWMPR
ncbi:unnamed protein product, partial [Allacma fusca]